MASPYHAGWQPATFKSSRGSRAEKSAQSAADFMDEDEKAEVEELSLQTASEFDTFGSTAVELARQGEQSGPIPGLLPQLFVLPSLESTGEALPMAPGDT